MGGTCSGKHCSGDHWHLTSFGCGTQRCNAPKPCDANPWCVEPEFKSHKAVRMLAVACNYDYDKRNALTGITDGESISLLARDAGVEEVLLMRDDCGMDKPLFPTKANVKAQMEAMGKNCRPEDTFIFFYAGHGANVPAGNYYMDSSHIDDAFCTPGPKGQLSVDYFFIDEDFAIHLDSCLPSTAHAFVIADCCHSGSIADIDDYHWGTRPVCSVTACRDNETDADTGHGGMLTIAIEECTKTLTSCKAVEFSVQALFDRVKSYVKRCVGNSQHVVLKYANLDPTLVAWPLQPPIPELLPVASTRGVHAICAFCGSTSVDESPFCQHCGKPRSSARRGLMVESRGPAMTFPAAISDRLPLSMTSPRPRFSSSEFRTAFENGTAGDYMESFASANRSNMCTASARANSLPSTISRRNVSTTIADRWSVMPSCSYSQKLGKAISPVAGQATSRDLQVPPFIPKGSTVALGRPPLASFVSEEPPMSTGNSFGSIIRDAISSNRMEPRKNFDGRLATFNQPLASRNSGKQNLMN